MAEASSTVAAKNKPPKFSVSVKFSDAAFESVDYDEDDVDAVRFNCVQSWFLAASQKNKEKFLCRLLEKITAKALYILLKALDCSRDKISVYAAAYQTTNFVYDKNLDDHNRSLKQTNLEETIKEELDWYDCLNESKQLDIIFELLRLSGGPLTRIIFYKSLSIHQDQKKNANTNETDRFANDDHVYKNIAPPYDPKDPQTVEAEKAKRKWDEVINKYRIQVEGKPEVARQKPKSSTSPRKNVKSPRKNVKSPRKKVKSPRKNVKSPRKNVKSPKKSGKQIEQGQMMIDRVQLLPVWIIKQIFGYLDLKTLQKLKNVNGYWAYVIDDMSRERVVRKHVEKTLKKIENNIDPAFVGRDDNVKSKLSRTSALEKRLQKLDRRGAIQPALAIVDGARVFPQKSLLTDATSGPKSARYIMPVDKLQAFPRNIPVDSSLHRNPSCVLNEVTKITEQASTATPTLSEGVSSDSVVYKITSPN